MKQGATLQHPLACQQSLAVPFLNTCQCTSQGCSIPQPVVACKFPNLGIACCYRCQVAVTVVGIAYRYITRIDCTLQQALGIVVVGESYGVACINGSIFGLYTVVVIVSISHRCTSTCFLYRTMITVVIISCGYTVNGS